MDEERRIRQLEKEKMLEKQRIQQLEMDEERRIQQLEMDEERRIHQLEMDEERRIHQLEKQTHQIRQGHSFQKGHGHLVVYITYCGGHYTAD
jgi:hypothetical protein